MAYFKCKGIIKAAPGSESFTATGTWTVPSGVRKVSLVLVGAGGSGGNGYRCTVGDHNYAGAGGGGAGGKITRVSDLTVHKGDVLSVVVGSGNTTITVNGTTYTADKGGDGGSYYWNGAYPYPGGGGSGGSGGGGGNYSKDNNPRSQTAGGSNGGNGSSGIGPSASLNNGGGGNGQNCYVNGVLMCSGGRGGSAYANGTPSGSRSGGGANTGNGGDGGFGGYGNSMSGGMGGGTGLAIISW